MSADATFITRLDASGTGPTLAVKDIIDVVGIPTTAGSRAVEIDAVPATADARCLEGARAVDARIVGKANLHELAYGAAGVNEWFGTPVNPFDPGVVPGGSSSGSAVAVANGDAEIALGSDTGGSVRVPAAFCGITGLKTTWGRIPLEGVWKLAPSLDTIGPMAREVDGVEAGMALLEPGFTPGRPATVFGRIRPADIDVDPLIHTAIDRVLAVLDVEIIDIDMPNWLKAYRVALDLLVVEAAESNARLLADPERASLLSAPVRERLESVSKVTPERAERARQGRDWCLAQFAPCFAAAQVLALPSIGFFPPPLKEAYDHVYTYLTMPANLAGIPALSLPVPSSSRFPASLQLIGPTNSEELLIGTGKLVETAVQAGK